VQDVFEPGFQVRVRENSAAHFSPVKTALSGDKILTKFTVNLTQGGLAGFDDPMCDDICVNDWHAQLGETVRHCCFAGGYATGENNDESVFAGQCIKKFGLLFSRTRLKEHNSP